MGAAGIGHDMQLKSGVPFPADSRARIYIYGFDRDDGIADARKPREDRTFRSAGLETKPTAVYYNIGTRRF